MTAVEGWMGQDEIDGLLERLRQLPAANVDDAMDRISAVESAIRPMWAGARVAAQAYTVLTRSGDSLGVREAIERATPGQVVVVNGFADESRALAGEFLAMRAKARHLAGFVIDGAIRDLDAIEEMGVPVFARAVTPAGPFQNGPQRQQVPVAIGGQCVVPGDVVVGDSDGVVIISLGQLRETVEAAESIQENEVLRRASEHARTRSA